MGIAEINRRQVWPERNRPLEQHSLYRKVDRIVRELIPGRVLEVGCSDGRFLGRLRSLGWSVAGIDIQPQTADYIVEHDAANPFPFGSEFDLVVAVEVIEHVADTDRFLANCANVLKPGGTLVLTTPNLLFGVNRLLMLFGRRPLFAYADYHARMFVWSDLREKVGRRFEIERLRGSHVLVGPRHGRAFRFFSVLGDIFPTISAHLIVEARKSAIRGRPPMTVLGLERG
jgi:SAM-dependent methyltransferase